jgi:hypothetical protein
MSASRLSPSIPLGEICPRGVLFRGSTVTECASTLRPPLVGEAVDCFEARSARLKSRRLRTIGGTGGAGAQRHRREHKRSTETSPLGVHAASATLMMEGAERGGKQGSHERGRASPRSPVLGLRERRSVYTIPRAMFDPDEFLWNLNRLGICHLSI